MTSNPIKSLVEELRQIANDDTIEFKSAPIEDGSVQLLKMQHRAAFQIAAIHKWLTKHAEPDDIVPLSGVLAAFADILDARQPLLLTRVRTKARPNGETVKFPEHWAKLRDLCCVTMRAYMDAGKKKREAASSIVRHMDNLGIPDPYGNPFESDAVMAWLKEPESKELRKRLEERMRPQPAIMVDPISGRWWEGEHYHPLWKRPDDLAKDILIRWRSEALQFGYELPEPKIPLRLQGHR